MNTAFELFPDSAAAKGDRKALKGETDPSGEQIAFASLMRGVHWWILWERLPPLLQGAYRPAQSLRHCRNRVGSPLPGGAVSWIRAEARASSRTTSGQLWATASPLASRRNTFGVAGVATTEGATT